MTDLMNKVSTKTGVPVEHLVGPLQAHEMPVRGGLFVRVSPKTGDIVYSIYSDRVGKFGLYSDTVAGANRRSYKYSKKSALWFGVTEAYSKAKAS